MIAKKFLSPALAAAVLYVSGGAMAVNSTPSAPVSNGGVQPRLAICA